MPVADDENALVQTATAARAGRRAVPGTATGNARIGWVAGYAAAGFVLFLCYLKIAETVPVTSDGGNNALQAWDMLHGNWLLRGWQLGDASYYTTELPEYALVEIFRGLSPAVVHICAAITYTLLVVLAGLLAKADKTGKEGLVRVAIASGIMIAPQIGAGTSLLLIAPNHTGTGVPLLLTFLLLDRIKRGWRVPVIVGVMLVWAQVGDRTAVTLGVLPIVVVCGTRAYRDVVQRREPVRAHWFDLALVACALISVGVAIAIVKIIAGVGGYTVGPVNSALAPSSLWPAHVTFVIDGVLRLFGASFNAGPLGFATALSVVHLAGVALAAWAVCRVIRRFFACDDMIAQILVVAIVTQLSLYAISMLPYDSLQSHEIASVLPFGAVLAGRVLAGRLTKARLLPALAVVACGYLLALGYGAATPAVPAHDQALANWLGAHHLTAGVGSFAEGSSVDVASHGAVMVTVPWFHPDFVSRGNLFEQDAASFDPRKHYANFVVTTMQDGSAFYIQPSWIIRDFGKPAHVYHYQSWTIMTWNKNLLKNIRLAPLDLLAITGAMAPQIPNKPERDGASDGGGRIAQLLPARSAHPRPRRR
jgi:hypothetical protein